MWDLITVAGPLHACRSLAEYPSRVTEALVAMQRGTARRANGDRVAVPFRSLIVGGGLLQLDMIDALLARFGPKLRCFPDPVFATRLGGHLLLQDRTPGLIVDVGQTAIKVMSAGDGYIVPRDWAVLPHADTVPPAHLEQQREALRAFVASAIRAHAGVSPRSLVLALPCDFPGDVPGACTYAGLEGDAGFVDAVLSLAGLADASCFLLNDAVLAALSAAQHFAPVSPDTLVVTLGFGVGAALIEGDVHVD